MDGQYMRESIMSVKYIVPMLMVTLWVGVSTHFQLFQWLLTRFNYVQCLSPLAYS